MSFISLSEYSKLITEKKFDKYTCGCLMVEIDLDMSKYHKLIEKEDIDPANGLEKDSHITILYGIDSDVRADDFKDKLPDIDEVEIKLTKASLFENEKFDVLKFEVKSAMCNKLNKIMTKAVEYSNNYPDYEPHATIAYLKPGTGKKYVKLINDDFEEIKLKGSKYIFSYPDNEKISFK